MKLTEHIVFPPFRLDPVNEQLWRENQLVPLPPKTFAVLRYLVEQSGRLVTKEELLKAVWSDTRVSEGVLKGYIRDLRDALGDDSHQPRFIETVPRRGNKFIAPLTTITLSIQGPESRSPQREAETPLPQAVPKKIVGRGAELAQLQRSLDKARRGERQIVFVTGEPGIGKTTLVEEFLFGVQRREKLGVQNSEPRTLNTDRPSTPDLWIGRGQCVEQYGAGEAYLPVLEALGRVGRSPGGEQLVARLNQYAPTWLVQMPALLGAADLEALQRRVTGATRERMLREMVEAIEALTADHSLVLWLEDLHWADYSTVDWLTAIAQQRGAARLLVIGTYRPADVSISSHPLKGVKQELQARGQCEDVWLRFLIPEEVGQYLATRYPNHQFPLNLAQVVHRNTDGNPLFVVNMVDYLTAQNVIGEVEGHWRLRTTIEEVGRGVPESLRQLIEKHVERLSEEQQRLLEVASVVGTAFSAATVAAGIEAQVEQVEEWCEVLAKRGQFLQAQEPSVLPDGTLCGSYKFLHTLYQAVLYERMPTMRRLRLHRRVGDSEERAYGDRAREIASELAVHFERGQDVQRAVKYLQFAAENALSRYAHREAAEYQQRALTLLQSLPDTSARAQQELALQIALAVSLTTTKGFADPGVERAYARARQLCQQIGDVPTLMPVLYGLWNFYLVRPDMQTAQELADQMLVIAQREQDPAFLLAAQNAQTQTLFERGDIAASRFPMEQVLALYEPQKHRLLADLYGEDLGVSCQVFAIWLMWQLGYPEQASRHADAVRKIAEENAHPMSLAQALCFGGTLRAHFRSLQKLQEMVEVLLPLCREYDLSLWLAWGTVMHGWLMVEHGQGETGLAEIRQGIVDWRATGSGIWLPYYRSLLVEACGKVGRLAEGLQVVEEALAESRVNGEVWYEAELYRLKGMLTLRSQASLEQVSSKSRTSRRQVENKSEITDPRSLTPDPEAKAEACFLKALDIARQQQAKSLELRAVMSLARLWQRQGKQHEAHNALSEIYNWFTEGFDTADLKDAKSLLEELASNVAVTSQSGATPVSDKSKKSRAR